MNDRSALMRSITDAPDDDAPRLVFADWLDENGESPRAAFVRDQVLLAKLPEYDARRWLWTSPFSPKYQPFYWPEPLPRGESFSWGDYRRGFRDGVSMWNAAAFVGESPFVFGAAPITALELAGGAAELRPLTRIPALSQIRSLGTFGRQVLSADGAAVLLGAAVLSRLDRVNLNSHRLDEAMMFALTGRVACRPRSISLRLCDVTPPRVRQLARSPLFEDVRELFLASNAIDADGLRAMADEGLFARLTRLDLSHNPVGPSGAAVLASLKDCSLERLDVSNARLGSDGCRELAAAPWLGQLRELRLAGNEIRNPGAAALAAAKLARLEALDLGRNHVQLLGVRALTKSGRFGALAYLNLNGNRIGAKGARVLADATTMTTVRQLALGECDLGSSGVAALAGSERLAGVRVLSVRQNRGGAVAARALAASVALGGLEFLDAADNAMPDDAKSALRAAFGRRAYVG